MKSFTFYKQLNATDCGPTCLRMIAKYYGRHYNGDSVRQVAGFRKEGVSLFGISEAAEKIGFRTRGIQLTYNQLTKDAQLPCILHWNQNHFVVFFNFSRIRGGRLKLADPDKGIITYTKKEFLQYWTSTKTEDGENAGTALLLEPTPAFYEQKGEKETTLNWGNILQYLTNSKWQISQVFIALFIASLLQLIFPFLTQSIVDTGINSQNLQYITIVLIAQLMLVFSRTIVDFIRTRILLQVSSVVNLSILSDFWMKLTHLPISYFDNHHTGDTLQRIGDHRNIQNFLTGTALNTFFSLFNFILFAIVLAWYNAQLFFVFTAGSIIYFIWVYFFLGIRRKMNYRNFNLSAKENNATLQLVQGMQEIKLHNAEQFKRWEWESIQAGIIKLGFKNLSYSQVQQAGALLINQGKDIIITFLVACLVIDGRLTLGAMLAIQYILGQLNSPVEQFISFTQSAQDAKISMERLNEVHQLQDEEPSSPNFSNGSAALMQILPENKTISFNNVSFTYSGAGNDAVLQNIDLEIPEGKVTAIVGVSGSGKTTMLKLLLKFFCNYSGDIKIGFTNFQYISPSYWRKQCGAVLQDGFIFNDSIARNIAVGDITIDFAGLIQSCKTANILSFIESLPNGFNTKLGVDGIGMSQGQKQRLLIARAIYKNPQYLFFDEATNALDANNEIAIVENLQKFFANRTVVVVAHRLSTVKNADKIVVLHNGNIIEQGNHQQLSLLKGKYFELVKNQLELGA